ncbi:homoserine O-acetyltransferase [Lentisphaerota bacterium WC36G]|nr:homoserine O-acetyltransferase [Lentisphaerae bacterium WC36]
MSKEFNNNNNNDYIVQPKFFTFGESDVDKLLLENGKSFGPVTICYETYGTLNADASNAVLILHALTGDAHVAGKHHIDDKKPGWWDEMVGPNKPFDTERYFIVCSNVIGGCSGSTGPKSINPETNDAYNMNFPVITIQDMVKAQHRLMQHLKIEKWLAIAGGSMGGMQALEWSISFPEAVNGVIALATTAKLSPQSIAFDWVGREAVKTDHAWQNGYYKDNGEIKGLSTARMLAHITYLSDESMSKKFGRNLQENENISFDFARDFAVESYLEYQGQRFVERFDANSYLYITRAMDYFDLSAANDGSLTNTFRVVNKDANFLVISFSSDWLFPPYQSEAIVRALLQNDIACSYCCIESSYGHDAFLLECETLGEMIHDFLSNLED